MELWPACIKNIPIGEYRPKILKDSVSPGLDLIEMGVELNKQNGLGETALMVAVQQGDLLMVKELCAKAPSSINQQNKKVRPHYFWQ